MGGQLLLLMICIANGLVLFANAVYMDVTYDTTKSSMTLSCSYYSITTTSIRWYRNSSLTLKTKWKFFGSPILEYKETGQDLKTSGMVKLRDWNKINLEILPENAGTVWHCCEYKAFKYGVCSDSIKIGMNDTSTNDRNTSPKTPDEDIKFNGSLTLTKVQVEQLQVTLSCTINEYIDADKWFVLWWRNFSLAFMTNGTSALKEGDDTTSTDASNGPTSATGMNGIHLAAGPHQYNVTFNLSEDLTGTWICSNPYLRKEKSNNITIDILDLSSSGTDGSSSTTHGSTTPDEGSASPATHDVGSTSATTIDSGTASPATRDADNPSAATQDADNPSAATQDAATQATLPPAVSLNSLDGMLPIIAGTLCGVISLLIITVTIVLRRRRNKKSKDAQESGGHKANAREEIVMEDNELYEGGTFDYSADAQKKEIVMEDNELYEGGRFNNTVEVQKKEIVLVDNDLYEGDTMKDQGKENCDIEMQMNVIYSSSP